VRIYLDWTAAELPKELFSKINFYTKYFLYYRQKDWKKLWCHLWWQPCFPRKELPIFNRRLLESHTTWRKIA